MRTVDPYRDLDVIDARGPRTNQCVVALGCWLAIWFNLPWLVALLALQLAVGLTLGRRWCLPCRLWFDILQRFIGEGDIEDARPPRFANQLGLAMLSAATVAYAVGASTAGMLLTLVVAALASFAGITGLCVGCYLYQGIALARSVGVRTGSLRVIDPEPVLAGSPSTRFGEGDVVLFTHPLCGDCHRTLARLRDMDEYVHVVDVRSHG